MSTWVWPIFLEFLKGSSKTILMITAVLTPLMVILEIVKDTNLLEKIARVIQPLMKLMTLSKESAFPLLAGIFFGISYGSGVIYQVNREGKLTVRDMTLISVFLGACHGMIEDPGIFAAIGANWWVIIVTRVLTALLLVAVIGRLWSGKLDRETAVSLEDDL